jgi:predicted amidophosphoribosyltransferase
MLTSLLPLACPGCGCPADPVCARCQHALAPAPHAAPPPHVDGWAAPFAYEGVARELIARVKYRRKHAATGWLAAAMAPLVGPPVPAVVTWVPTTSARRHERGFDHAELLARAVARLLGRRAVRLLCRGSGGPQTGLAAAARRLGPELVARSHVPASVLLVDDVATTGATVEAGARALRAAGAVSVRVLTAARTPVRPW